MIMQNIKVDIFECAKIGKLFESMLHFSGIRYWNMKGGAVLEV